DLIGLKIRDPLGRLFIDELDGVGLVEKPSGELLCELNVVPGPVPRLVFEAERRRSAVGADDQFATRQYLVQFAATGLLRRCRDGRCLTCLWGGGLRCRRGRL